MDQAEIKDDLWVSRYAAVEELRQTCAASFFCPVCGTRAEAFLPGGAQTKRQNAKCPSCGSLERHRMLWLYLANHVWGAAPGAKRDVLHVSPEPFLQERLKHRGDVNYVSGDLLVPGCTCRLDLTDMCFWDDQFDLVICSHVLEHVPDDAAAMREMRRVLRPSGTLVLMVPIYGDTTYEDPSITEPEDRLAHFGQEDHVRKYGRDIVGRLTAVGLDVRQWPRPNEPGEALLHFIAASRRTLLACTPRRAAGAAALG